MPRSNLTEQMLAALDKEIARITGGVQRAAERPDGDLLFTNDLTWVFTRGVHMGRVYALGALRTVVFEVRSNKSDRFDGPLGHLEVNEAVNCSLRCLAATSKNWQATPTFGTSHVRYLQAGERKGVADVLKRSHRRSDHRCRTRLEPLIRRPRVAGLPPREMSGPVDVLLASGEQCHKVSRMFIGRVIRQGRTSGRIRHAQLSAGGTNRAASVPFSPVTNLPVPRNLA